MRRFLSSVFRANPSPPKAPARRRSSVPQLEVLEDRQLLAAQINPGTTDLVILGSDNTADIVEVVINDVDDQIRVIQNGVQTFEGQSSLVNVISAKLRRGDDSFNLRLAEGSDFERAKKVLVFLGDGADKADFDLFNAGAAELKANLEISVLDSFATSLNRDVVNLVFGKINEDVQLKVNANLGAGDDQFIATMMENIDDDARVSFLLNGDAGKDTLGIIAVDAVKIDDGAQLAVDLRGGADNDHLFLAYDGQLDGALLVRASGGDGRDKLRAGIHLNALSEGVLDVILRGGAQIDRVSNLTGTLVNDSDGVTILNLFAIQD